MPSVFNFCDSVSPYFTYDGENFYRIHGMDQQISGARHLFFHSNTGIAKGFWAGRVFLDCNEWIATGTFRNSLYVEPIAQLTNVRDLRLLVDYQGALKLRIFCATLGKPVDCLQELDLFSRSRVQHLLPIGLATDLPENSRLFWHVDGLAGGVDLYNLSFVTTAAPRTDCRLIVLLRTFGRTVELKAILKRFADAGREDTFYGSVLDHICFWVFDTTSGCASEYNEPWQKHLNIRIWVGENLGGGGNAGQMLQLLEESCRTADNPPTEILILDDDLSLSPESLARYFMFCAYRKRDDIVCSVPILMKSRPTVVWEDGGFWGRLNFHEGGSLSKKRNLFPNLLKHGKQLDGADGLDEFCPLNPCEYSTFIFFGISMKAFRKLGYPVPFFLRGDDIEYSLRAQELGLEMFTNPNLAAWHEPAHSYGQEYMAILHGVIINLTYGEHQLDFYRRFFEERMHEHASIDDLVGLSLYKDILAELVNPASPVLSIDFQHHYLSKLKSFSAARTQKLHEVDRVRFEEQCKENDVLLVPFVYPGYQKGVSNYKSVVVCNPSIKVYREIAPTSFAEKCAVLQSYLDFLVRLEAQFVDVQLLWRQRLKNSREESFWSAIRDKYKASTKIIFSANKTPTNIKKGLAITITEVEEEKPGVSDRPWLRKVRESFGARHEGRSYARANGSTRKVGKSLASLPRDFDPAVYLHINQDVKDSGMDPVDHYLRFGQAEGRKYKL